jgi:hypothetical protein
MTVTPSRVKPQPNIALPFESEVDKEGLHYTEEKPGV